MDALSTSVQVLGLPIRKLELVLATAIPGARLALDVPADGDRGTWWLDIDDVRGRHVAVEWQPGRNAFGISLVTGETGLGEVADVWVVSVEDAATRVSELLGVTGRARGRARWKAAQ